ncbi:MAG: HAD-IC family P-type ATPase [Candidatus Gottesmanbacteria bacterium]|nr:HAD-IC family P-type ATPase [Candidatus Gottesmanbacteria bacterium]
MHASTVSSRHGLTTDEARLRLVHYGQNLLPEKPSFTAVSIFIHQFTSPLIYILLGAAAITVLLRDFVDAAVIGMAVLVNTILGFIQEYKAETALLSLKKILTPQAKVIRDGKPVTIAASLLVPGDLVLLTSGERVPGDGTVVEAVRLFINESWLTGESVPVEKNTPTSPSQLNPNNAVSMGTVVASGRGLIKITATGMHTVIGTMAQTLNQTKKEDTPLQKEISGLARTLAVIVVVLCGLLFILGVLHGQAFVVMASTVVAIAVSAIPEGLAVSLTVILAIGMQRVMKRNALVRKMVAAETLGSISTICVDKTGTITQGVMSVVKSDLTDTTQAMRAAVLANNLEEPLEIALWDFTRTLGQGDPQQIADTHKRISELPFDSVNKYMSVTTRDGVWTKGAPEVVLAMSDLPKHTQSIWMQKVTKWGSEGLRVLGLLHNKTFLGIIGIADPVREGVADAVAHVQEAGVAITMVTGDYRATAQSVLSAIGLPIKNPEHEIMEGHEVASITEDELVARVRGIRLFCRVSPDQKLKIVSALQKAGEVVAMTGDGVNDAVAIKKADIGIVVSGASDVARETADIVLLDSNFKTIVAAIQEGRAIYDNIRKVTFYLLSNSFVEISLIATTIVLGLPLPLTAIQILWINLVDDGIPTLALATDPRSHDLMRSKPRLKSAPIVDRRMGILIVCISGVIASVSLAVFLWTGGERTIALSRTMVFTLVAISTLVYVFSCRSVDRPMKLISVFHNRWLLGSVAMGFALQLFAVYHPWGNLAFGTVPLSATSWAVILGASVLIMGMIEGMKRFNKITN